MTAYLLSKLCLEAGLPAGVLNIVHGTGAKGRLGHRRSQRCKSSLVHRRHKNRRRDRTNGRADVQKLSLELGGKNPNIIFADCNYEEMLATTVRSSFSNQGEICLCGSRIFVERPMYEQFKGDFISRVSALKVGDPLEAETDVGAIVSKPHFEKIMSYIDLARKEGGTILAGGKQFNLDGRCADGWFHRADRDRRPALRLPDEPGRDIRPGRRR